VLPQEQPTCEVLLSVSLKSNPNGLFHKKLLDWYDRNQRDLPWRKKTSPYRTFVSEMMLQQTQVKTVIPYFERFIRELPDWNALAQATEEKVFKLWEGLGYYRRARNLRAAAQKVVADHGGRLPESHAEILKLPGVGPYSAGAILSIAFQKPYPLVDGNVIRVFSRLFLLRGPLKSGPGLKKVWSLAEKRVPPKRPGDYNQALMELGATVCLAETPQCLLCPLLSLCGAARKGVQGELPETEKARKNLEVCVAVLLVKKGEKVLARKRPEGERWLKGMWEFPSAEGETFEKALRQLEKQWKVQAGRQELKEVKHQITHHKIRMKIYPARTAGGKIPAGARWVTSAQLDSLPFSSAQNKLRARVRSAESKGPRAVPGTLFAPPIRN
jgi:A/G-specific adenine glycosylase